MEVANQYTDPDTGFKVCVRQLFCHFDIFPSTSPSLRIWIFCRPSSYSCHLVTQMIPGTQRPDGTWRKPIRVREGYVPQVSFNSKPSLFNERFVSGWSCRVPIKRKCYSKGKAEWLHSRNGSTLCLCLCLLFYSRPLLLRLSSNCACRLKSKIQKEEKELCANNHSSPGESNVWSENKVKP